MAKPVGDLKKIPRAQLARIDKDELIESILAATDPSETLIQDLKEKLNELTNEVKELR